MANRLNTRSILPVNNYYLQDYNQYNKGCFRYLFPVENKKIKKKKNKKLYLHYYDCVLKHLKYNYES